MPDILMKRPLGRLDLIEIGAKKRSGSIELDTDKEKFACSSR
jgi:hypothetical protein